MRAWPRRFLIAALAITAGAAPAATTAVAAGSTTGSPSGAGAGSVVLPSGGRPDPNRPVYDVSVRLRPDIAQADGTLSVRFTPDLPIDRLVLRLWPNGPKSGDPAPGHLTLSDVQLDGAPADAVARPDLTTAIVALPGAVPAGRQVALSLRWSLRLRGSRSDRSEAVGGAMRLGSFLPMLAWEPGVGWALDPPTSASGEASTFPTADFRIVIDAPAGTDVLATGVRGADGVWTATAVRDVAMTVGSFHIVTGTARAPEPVAVTVGVQRGLERGDPPEAYLRKVIASLEAHSRRFGAYPWPSLSVGIAPGLTGGIEYPMHIMQGPGSIGRTTSHEVGHQWFYGLVGNDQGRDPWLDEGLASWAEARFEGTVAAFRAKPIPAVGQGKAGLPMTFWSRNSSAYYRSVYVQPVQALAELGTQDAVDAALRDYVSRAAYAIATPAQLRAVLIEHFPSAGPVLDRYGLTG